MTNPSVERLREWASHHSNVTPLDGTDRNSPTFGDLRVLLQAAAPPQDDPEPPKDDEDEYGPDREETDDR